MIWTTPPKSTVTFRLSAKFGTAIRRELKPGQMTDVEETLEIERILVQHGVPFKRYTSFKLKLNDARWSGLIASLESSWKDNKLCISSCDIAEPAPSINDAQNWFELLHGDRELRTPSRPPSERHFCHRVYHPVASQAFLDCVTAHNLSGLGSIRLVDSALDPRSAWHDVFALLPIGRGLDHPLLDREKYEAMNGPEHKRQDLIEGMPYACRDWWPSGVAIEPELIARLASITDSGQYNFRLSRSARVVREHLPPADFAYLAWDIDNRSDSVPSPHERRRSIACSSRARTALIEGGMMTPRDFGAIQSVPMEESDSPILDGATSYPIPPPRFTAQEASDEKRQRDIVRVRSGQRLRSRNVPTQAELLDQLKRRASIGELPWATVSSTGQFEEMLNAKGFAQTPRSWQAIAKYLPLAFEGTDERGETVEFEMAVPKRNTWPASDNGSAPSESPSDTDFVIGYVACGDWYAIRPTDPLMPDDARIVLWDHETSSIADEWPTVAAFAAFLLELADSASSSS